MLVRLHHGQFRCQFVLCGLCEAQGLFKAIHGDQLVKVEAAKESLAVKIRESCIVNCVGGSVISTVKWAAKRASSSSETGSAPPITNNLAQCGELCVVIEIEVAPFLFGITNNLAQCGELCVVIEIEVAPFLFDITNKLAQRGELCVVIEIEVATFLFDITNKLAQRGELCVVIEIQEAPFQLVMWQCQSSGDRGLID